jgi:WD40 repeat protein
MSHIFISYSRKDLPFAQKIVDALAENDLDTWIDWKSIPKGEDWEQEIYRGIEEADAFLFLISQDSVISQMCNKEIAHAAKNGKRILPIFISNVEDKDVYAVTENLLNEETKEEINRRNFIFCREERDDFEKAIEETRKTIHTDYEWLQYHTRLLVKALEWDRRIETKDTSRLLRGRELREAELRLAEVNSQTDPQPTVLQQQFIRTGRQQEERQRRRLMVGLGTGFFILVLVSLFAWRQRQVSRDEANLRSTAEAEAAHQARISLSRKLAGAAQTVLSDHPQESLLLSIEALNALEPGDPSIPDGEQSLRDALAQAGGLALGQGITPGVAPIISPDNHWLAAGSSDGAIRVWDLTASHAFNAMLISTAQEGPVQAITITQDSRWLIAAIAETKIRLWDLADFDPKHIPLELSVDDCPIYILRASPDNRTLVIVCSNDSVRVWDLAARDPAIPPVTLQQKEASTKTGVFGPGTVFIPGDREQLVSISGDSRWLAVANNNIAFLWNLKFLELSAQPAILDGYRFPVTALTFSPDNRWLAVADAKTILLWNLSDPDPATAPVMATDHFQLSTIAFNPDGGLLAAGNSDGVVRLWDLTSTDPATAYFDVEGQAQFMNAIAFSRDHRWMITAGRDVRLLDISSTLFNATPLILRGNENPVIAIKVSRNSRWLVALDNDTSLRLWDLLSPQPYASPSVLWWHSGYGSLKAIATSPNDNRWLAISGGNGVAIWDFARSNFLDKPVLLSDQTANLLAISPDNRWLAAGGQESDLFLWDLSSIETNRHIHMPLSHPVEVSALSFSPNNQWLGTAGLDQTVSLWNLSAPDPLKTAIPLSGNLAAVSVLSFSPSSKKLVAVGSADTYLWSLDTLDQVDTPKKIGETGFPIAGAAFSPDDRWLAVGENDVHITDLTTSDMNAGFVFTQVGTPVSFSPDGRFIVTINYATPYLLKVDSQKVDPIPLSGHEERVTGSVFSPDSRWLATGGWDDTARLWDLTDEEPGATAVILRSLSNWLPHVQFLAFTPDNRWLVMGIENGTIYLWALQQADLIEQACKTAGRNLNQDEWDQYFTGERQKTCAQWP